MIAAAFTQAVALLPNLNLIDYILKSYSTGRNSIFQHIIISVIYIEISLIIQPVCSSTELSDPLSMDSEAIQLFRGSVSPQSS